MRGELEPCSAIHREESKGGVGENVVADALDELATDSFGDGLGFGKISAEKPGAVEVQGALKTRSVVGVEVFDEAPMDVLPCAVAEAAADAADDGWSLASPSFGTIVAFTKIPAFVDMDEIFH